MSKTYSILTAPEWSLKRESRKGTSTVDIIAINKSLPKVISAMIA
jgi:hypothetical protein